MIMQCKYGIIYREKITIHEKMLSSCGYRIGSVLKACSIYQGFAVN